MGIKLFNTLSGKKEEFVPINPPNVGMYVCGITAYDSCHLGHARAAVVFDCVYRHLMYRGYKVNFVRNYTDVDDKIINRANKEGLSCADISERYIKEYEDDMGALGVLDPNIKPKATEHIECMIDTIKSLIAKELAYEVGGNVFYSVRKFPGYGKLSGKKIEELESGARVDVNETKQDPLDFALWKTAKPGEPTWPSPWGDGRPGWHIECSAMSSKYLSQPFDIHGGGRDLIFPHHENEIAQAEGACGCEFVKYWLHNGFINIDSEKMSKSLGNFTTVRDILKQYDAEAVRLFLLSNHYRSPIDYTESAMSEATASLDRFYETAERVIKASKAADTGSSIDPASIAALKTTLESACARFDAAMDEDFNTAQAIGVVFEVIRAINRYLDASNDTIPESELWIVERFENLKNITDRVLAIFGSDPADYRANAALRGMAARGIDSAEIESLLAERRDARKAKDFAKSDAIRDALLARNIEIKDRPDGTTEWKIR